MNAIEVKNLKKYFGKTKAVDDISFEVQKGEIFGFLGPNGAGKTTTIRCLMGFLHPNSGQINILNSNTDTKNCQLKNKIGYLPGDVRLYEGWTGQEHINFLEKLRSKKSIAGQLIKKLNYNPEIKFKNLSSGNKQKLGLILALCFEPELIIMDEPTLGLDPLLQNTIYELLENFQKKGTTIFMSSHNLAEVERMCQRVGIIKNGRLIAVEAVKELKAKRMHLVKISFAGGFDRQTFASENIQIQKQLPDGLILGVRGDINPLIKKLSTLNIKELEITYASLEDIFLEYYHTNNKTLFDPDELSQLNQQNNITENKDDLMEIPKLEE